MGLSSAYRSFSEPPGIGSTRHELHVRIYEYKLTIILQGFDNDLIENHLKIISADPSGKVVYSFVVPQSFTNRMGNLHGGAAALIFDVCTTGALAPIAKPGFWQYAGVTRALNVTYLRPAPVNEEVDVVCEVVHAGKRLTTIKGEIRSKDGKVLCMAEHLKVSIDPPAGGPPPKVGGRL